MEKKKMEMEKSRLINLALEFGFDKESARICLDRLVNLYGISLLNPNHIFII